MVFFFLLVGLLFSSCPYVFGLLLVCLSLLLVFGLLQAVSLVLDEARVEIARLMAELSLSDRS